MLIKICPMCWSTIFGNETKETGFFCRGTVEKCDYCGRKSHLIDGVVDENNESCAFDGSASVIARPYRTVTAQEEATLRQALHLFRLHEEALNRRRLPDLPEEEFENDSNFWLDW